MTNIGPVQQEWQGRSNEIKEAKLTGNGKLIAIKTYQRNRLKTALTAEHCGSTIERSHNTIERPRVLAFNYYCIPGSEHTRILTDKVYDLWLSHRKFTRMPAEERLQGYKAILAGILSNVLYADLTDHEGVRISRDEAYLRRESRYRPHTFNKRSLDVMDDLHEMGMVKQVRGEQWHRGHLAAMALNCPNRTKQTELHSTDTLKQLASSCGVTVLEDFTFNTERQEVVILKKDKSSALVEYEDTPQTEKLRRQVKIINASLEKCGDLLIPDSCTSHDQRQRFLVRKFTYESLESGGRLSGGFWMSMRKVERPVLLRINGEKTVEIDYTSIMTRIAYVVANQPLPHEGDLYNIPGLSPTSRPGVKKFLSALYFKESLPTKFPRGVAELLTPQDRAKGCSQVLRLIQQAHKGITPLFGTGIGHYLQHLESRLMVNVLLYCAKKDIPALPIHDCLIVAQSQRDRVSGIMERMGLRVLGRVMPVSLKAGDVKETTWDDEENEPV